MSRFEAFSERASALSGHDAAGALADLLLETAPGARLNPKLIASRLELRPEEVDELFDFAAGSDIRLVEEAEQLRCPHDDCATRIDRRPLLDAAANGEEPECPDCHRPIENPENEGVLRRYALTDEAAIEAAAWKIAQGQRPRLTVVILCAIGDELTQLRRQMELHGDVTENPQADGAVYLTVDFAGAAVDWTVHAAMTEQTNAAAASGAASAVMTYRPHIILFVGIAGSVADDVQLGDVVAADVVVDYEVGKAKPAKGNQPSVYEPRPLQQRSSFGLLQWAGIVRTDSRWRERIVEYNPKLIGEPNVHTEPIAAGSKVVADSESDVAQLIRQTAPRAVAVEMEGAGFLGAVHRFSDVDGLLVRGISDLVDGKSQSDGEGWRHQAVANASAFVFELLARYKPAPKPTPLAAG